MAEKNTKPVKEIKKSKKITGGKKEKTGKNGNPKSKEEKKLK